MAGAATSGGALGERAGLSMGAPTRDAFGQALRALGDEFPNLVTVDGDVGNSTRTEKFAADFPERHFNVGIAESNLVSVAGGMAASGKIPVAASFACFLLNNAFEQIRMSVAFPHVNCKLVGSHAGITVGEDGPSQMGTEDVALACSLPNVVVVVPADGASTAAATRAMLEHDGPVYLRLGRPKVPAVYGETLDEFEIGKALSLREGGDVTIIANGVMVAAALDAAAELAETGLQARVLDMHTVKPIDEQAVIKAAKETAGIIVAEEHLHHGGLGSVVAQVTSEHQPAPIRYVNIGDTYAESGSSDGLLEKYGLTAEKIATAAKSLTGQS